MDVRAPDDRRIHAAFVLPDSRAGGAQHVMLSFARALDPEKFLVDVIVVCAAGGLLVDLPSHVRVTRIGAARLSQGMPKLIGTLRRLRPAIVISVMGYLNLALLAARPLLKSKLIVREANAISATRSVLPWLPAGWLYRKLYPLADAIVAPTDAIQQQILAAVPRAQAVLVIANPVDEDLLRRRANPSKKPRGDGLSIVGAGRLTAQKGFDRLIEIMPLFPPNARLVIFGEGEARSALERQIEALGLADRVSLPGHSSDLPACIAGADVFVLPSRWEGLSNVSLEALAVGTPVIASDEANLEGLAREAPAGAVKIVPVGKEFADAIAQAPLDRGLRTEPRSSLLPARYRSANATAEFSALLRRVAA